MDRIGIVGHKGVCGKELIALLGEKKIVTFNRNETIKYDEIDVLFCCVDSKSAIDIVKNCTNKGLIIIDLSSAFRTHSSLPLVLPTVNSQVINNSLKIYSLPNCIVSILLTALYPLHKKHKIKEIFLTTFQAASGAGKVGLEAMNSDEKCAPFPYPLRNNLFLHESKSTHPTLSGEEEKILFETKKILNNQKIKMNVRCVRLCVERAHSIHAVVSFEQNTHTFEQNIHTIEETLAASPFITLHESACPKIAEHQKQVFVSSIRKVEAKQQTYDFWICGDQLLRGAALNAFDVYEILKEKQSNLALT